MVLSIVERKLRTLCSVLIFYPMVLSNKNVDPNIVREIVRNRVPICVSFAVGAVLCSLIGRLQAW